MPEWCKPTVEVVFICDKAWFDDGVSGLNDSSPPPCSRVTEARPQVGAYDFSVPNLPGIDTIDCNALGLAIPPPDVLVYKKAIARFLVRTPG